MQDFPMLGVSGTPEAGGQSRKGRGEEAGKGALGAVLCLPSLGLQGSFRA